MYSVERSTGLFFSTIRTYFSILQIVFIVIWIFYPASDYVLGQADEQDAEMSRHNPEPQPTTTAEKAGEEVFIDHGLIDLLQNERTSTEIKIKTLDDIIKQGPEQIKKYVEISTRLEPMFLTILDLTRHTDKDLSYKALIILNKSDLNTIVAEKLISQNSDVRKQTREIMTRRVKKNRAEMIWAIASDKLKHSKPIITDELARVKREIEKTGGTRVLVPSGSSQGDRYYVRAEWSARDSKTVDCLTKLFNKALISDRTLEDEKRLMKGKSIRYVYWYSKDWALWIADEIGGCGSKASFVRISLSKGK